MQPFTFHTLLPNAWIRPGSLALLLIAGLAFPFIDAETTFTPWGNLQGLRVQGELVEFEAGLRVVREDWSGFSAAVKYLQRPDYTRSGRERVVNSRFAGIAFREVLTDTAPGRATLTVEVTAEDEPMRSGVYYCLDLPGGLFDSATFELFDALASPVSLDLLSLAEQDSPAMVVQRIRIAGRRHTLELSLADPAEIRVRRDRSNRATALNDPRVEQLFEAPAPGESSGFQLYLKLMDGDAGKGTQVTARIEFNVSASPDPAPVRLTLEPKKPGRAFDGVGGNFRLQFPKTDPAVIRYCLDNLPVAWGRIDLPWAEWHPEEGTDPLARARSGELHSRVADAMEMARTLARRDIPVIVSVWSVPGWARAVRQPAGLRGTALNPEKSERILDSLAGALVFLKELYGVETPLISFNEPETGVEVRQTAPEHTEFVWRMGQRLANHGLATRMLLGDTAHGNPAALEFIRPGLEDPRLRGYVGALAFHTWRGCTAADLRQWRDAARTLNVPLLVTESGPDAHLHEYASVRLEPWFQLQEIDLYVRICADAQPATIMPWQLTTDYSVLTGGGVYSEEGPLRPTQRFWNLKQLGLTPRGAFALPIAADRGDVTSAAFGDLAEGAYTVHLVNNGGTRRAILRGLPEGVGELRCLVTNANRQMEECAAVKVEAGIAEFALPAASFVTLLGTRS